MHHLFMAEMAFIWIIQSYLHHLFHQFNVISISVKDLQFKTFGSVFFQVTQYVLNISFIYFLYCA